MVAEMVLPTVGIEVREGDPVGPRPRVVALYCTKSLLLDSKRAGLMNLLRIGG